MIYAIGDIHGDNAKMLEKLRGRKLINRDGDWIGGSSTLVFIGDLVDRWHYSIAVIENVIKWQKQAQSEGGEVVCVMGNHDAIFLSCALYEKYQKRTPELVVYNFVRNGGQIQDIDEIIQRDDLLEWMQNMPLLFLKNNILFQHVDSINYYIKYWGYKYPDLSGSQLVDAINNDAKNCTAQNGFDRFMKMTNLYERSFGAALQTQIVDYLKTFDAKLLVHGHTRCSGLDPEFKRDNLTLNIDCKLSEGYSDHPKRGCVVSFDNAPIAIEREDDFYHYVVA